MDTSPQHSGPIWAGVLLASLSPAVSLAIMRYLLTDGRSETDINISLARIFAIPIALVVTCCIGLPYVLILRERGSLSWSSVCFGTSLMGIPIYYALQVMISQTHGEEVASWGYGFGYGLIAGIAFCIGIWPKNLFRTDPLHAA